MDKPTTLKSLNIERGQTQKNVNYTVLLNTLSLLDQNTSMKALDLPCGDMEFLSYLHKLYPYAKLYGADLMPKNPANPINFSQMDLTGGFQELPESGFDLITSISGVMMFGNTARFINNCVSKLKNNGTFILTNDNNATIMDRLGYLLLARYRIFRPIYDDNELLTDIIPIQELCHLIRKNGITIDKIEYTSFYAKDLIYLPLALLIYPLQWLYLKKVKTLLPYSLTKAMYPFKHLFCKHYIITGHKT